MNFEGKVALVTEGNCGIGRATARIFAREGAKLVIAARNAERSQQVVDDIQANGGTAIFVRRCVSAFASGEGCGRGSRAVRTARLCRVP